MNFVGDGKHFTELAGDDDRRWALEQRVSKESVEYVWEGEDITERKMRGAILQLIWKN